MSEGYLGNQHLKKTGVPIEWTPELIREYAKCAADPVYFAKKYIKIVHVDKGLVPFEMYPYQEQIAREITDHRRVAVLTARQSGKALALDTPVPLFDGSWTTIADLKIGDVIIGSNGQQTTVTFKSDIHHKPSYVMTFESSDSPVVACEDHLWTVWDRYTRKFVTKTTKQLAANYKVVNKRGYSEYRYAISNIKPIKYPHRDLPVDPYTIGCWLGDGASASNTFTCHNDDRQHYESKGIGFTSDVSYERNSSNTVFTSGIADLRPTLRQLGLLKNKHIPKEYLTSSVEQRTLLLQGLMDTDGFIDGQCNIQLSRKNQRLVDDVYQLIVSLGFKVRVSHFESTNSTRLTFNTYEGSVIPVSIPRKLERLTVKKRDRYISSRSITSIELTDTVPTQCITVDADDSLFAFGRDYILTHNTTTAMAIILHYILFNEYKTVAILANKGDSAREVLSRIQLAYETLPKWLQQGILEWNKGSIELENGCKIYAGTTSSSAIRGKSCITGDNKVCVEEKGKYYLVEIKKVAEEGINSSIRKDATMLYTVYKTTNLINGKIYIGFHKIPSMESILYTESVYDSIFEDGYLGSGKLMKRALKKYGPENMKQELLLVTDNKREADNLERMIVNKDFVKEESNYNISIGGGSTILFGEANGFYGKKHTQETKDRIQKSRNETLKNNPFSWCEIIDNETGHVYYNRDEILKQFNITDTKIFRIRRKVNELIYSGRLTYKSEYLQQAAIKSHEAYLLQLAKRSEVRKRVSETVSKRFKGIPKSEESNIKRSKSISQWIAENPSAHKERMEKINKNPEKIRKMAEKQTGKIGITNLSTGKRTRHDPALPIPEGWVKGWKKN